MLKETKKCSGWVIMWQANNAHALFPPEAKSTCSTGVVLFCFDCLPLSYKCCPAQILGILLCNVNFA